MNLIKEKDKIKEWAKEKAVINQEWKFSSNNEESCWKLRKETTGIEEYDFSTLIELKEKLHEQWKGEEIFNDIEQTLAIAAIRACEIETGAGEIPTYVYVF